MDKVWSKRAKLSLASLLIMSLLLGSLAFALQKRINIEVDGKLIETKIYSGTVGDVLNQYQIVLGEKDLVEPSQETIITKDMKIQVIRAFTVKVLADGIIREITTTPVTGREAVALAGFTAGENDIVKTLPLEADKLGPQMGVEVIRVGQAEITQDEEIPFQTETTIDSTMEKGISKTVKAGQNGLKRTRLLITYHNGQEVKREILNVEILTQPQNQVIVMGNNTTVSRGGERFEFREARQMQSTAYTYTGNRTATGKSPAVGMVAVDPNVIPLGSKMYIEGYGYAQAEDTGGAIKGNKVDVFLESYSECLQWGRRTVKVYLMS